VSIEVAGGWERKAIQSFRSRSSPACGSEDAPEARGVDISVEAED
jgi:hypothetical protein